MQNGTRETYTFLTIHVLDGIYDREGITFLALGWYKLSVVRLGQNKSLKDHLIMPLPLGVN